MASREAFHRLTFISSIQEMILLLGLHNVLSPKDKVIFFIFAYLCEPGNFLLF